MGYDNAVNGQLHFTRKDVTVNSVVLPEEVQKIADSYGLVVPEAPVLPHGLSKAVVSELEADENISWWFDFNSEGTVADTDNSESGRTYHLFSYVAKIVKAAEADGCSVNGVLVIRHSEECKVSRIVVTNSSAREEKATISWPDGTIYNG
jgi:hypothetical protein